MRNHTSGVLGWCMLSWSCHTHCGLGVGRTFAPMYQGTANTSALEGKTVDQHRCPFRRKQGTTMSGFTLPPWERHSTRVTVGLSPHPLLTQRKGVKTMQEGFGRRNWACSGPSSPSFRVRQINSLPSREAPDPQGTLWLSTCAKDKVLGWSPCSPISLAVMRPITEAPPFSLLGFLLQWVWIQEQGKGCMPPNLSRCILWPSLLGSVL